MRLSVGILWLRLGDRLVIRYFGSGFEAVLICVHSVFRLLILGKRGLQCYYLSWDMVVWGGSRAGRLSVVIDGFSQVHSCRIVIGKRFF